jgi:hypothetical protein
VCYIFSFFSLLAINIIEKIIAGIDAIITTYKPILSGINNKKFAELNKMCAKMHGINEFVRQKINPSKIPKPKVTTIAIIDGACITPKHKAQATIAPHFGITPFSVVSISPRKTISSHIGAKIQR